jgi:hypothetical protein
LAYALVPKELRKKLGEKARQCVHLGYSDLTKGYRLMDLKSNVIFTAVSVAFDETRFPFREGAGQGVVKEQRASDNKWFVRVGGDVDPSQKVQSTAISGAPFAVDGGRFEALGELSEDAGEGGSGATAVEDGGVLEGPHDDAGGGDSTAAAVGDDVGPFGLPDLADLSLSPGEPSMPDLEPLLSPLEPPEQHLQEQAYEVEAIEDFRLGRPTSPGGGPVPWVQEELLVRWKGWSERTWEPVKNLSGAEDAVSKFFKVKRNANHRLECRAKFKGAVLDFDFQGAGDDDGGVASVPHTGPGEEEVGEDVAPQEQATGEGVSPKEQAAGMGGDTEAGEGVDTTNPIALRAKLTSIAVRLQGRAGHEVGKNGEVTVPVVDHVATGKLDLLSRLDNQAMGPLQLKALATKIEQLTEVAAMSKPDRLRLQPPRSVAEARQNVNWPDWQQAMQEEMDKMEEFGVWKLVPPKPGANLMSCKWVFDIKRDKLGEVLKLKARLTCRGFTQKEGRDFGATWAPTCRMRVFRMLMAEASSDSSIRTAQWDCTSAFLHAPVDYEMFMRQPEGFEVCDGDGAVRGVCKLLRALYGCKQASRLFHKEVRDHLLGHEHAEDSHAASGGPRGSEIPAFLLGEAPAGQSCLEVEDFPQLVPFDVKDPFA